MPTTRKTPTLDAALARIATIPSEAELRRTRWLNASRVLEDTSQLDRLTAREEAELEVFGRRVGGFNERTEDYS